VSASDNRSVSLPKCLFWAELHSPYSAVSFLAECGAKQQAPGHQTSRAPQSLAGPRSTCGSDLCSRKQQSSARYRDESEVTILAIQSLSDSHLPVSSCRMTRP
jgi:hypothetical protein